MDESGIYEKKNTELFKCFSFAEQPYDKIILWNNPECCLINVITIDNYQQLPKSVNNLITINTLDFAIQLQTYENIRIPVTSKQNIGLLLCKYHSHVCSSQIS